jgi:hypothetical protein
MFAIQKNRYHMGSDLSGPELNFYPPTSDESRYLSLVRRKRRATLPRAQSAQALRKACTPFSTLLAHEKANETAPPSAWWARPPLALCPPGALTNAE